ncbi:putative transmembrane protein [Gregarina niphandrodes]|uniref:Transmembrane protein n=1 Tax=Gregarina niphandrodes TaxID=110365 RepID=A0A023BDU7_GRENI|nr:putative transmembrane protein [Gregarina niphandrodes]EZG89732.1 putative transmembrane protein [Gregarina niphandrodes]|eukprot:XP_011128440.1 putative transmembrane protein [Gregarina niphandrodes]
MKNSDDQKQRENSDPATNPGLPTSCIFPMSPPTIVLSMASKRMRIERPEGFPHGHGLAPSLGGHVAAITACKAYAGLWGAIMLMAFGLTKKNIGRKDK